MATSNRASLEAEEKHDPTPSITPSSSVANSIIVDLEESSPDYDVSTIQKCLVVFTTSFVTLTACFSSTSLFSAASFIAEEFGTNADTINYSNAGVLLAMGCSNFVWGPFIPVRFQDQHFLLPLITR
jgi:hypothetical protein